MPIERGLVPVFVRCKVVKGHTYYQVIRGYRQGARVRHQVVVSLGRCPTVEDALRAEKRNLEKVKWALTRLARLGPPSSSALAKRHDDLNRQIAKAGAKVELLKSIIKGTYKPESPGTTPDAEPSEVVPTDSQELSLEG